MPMKATPISLPDDLKKKAEKYAKENNLSLADVVRMSLKKFLK